MRNTGLRNEYSFPLQPDAVRTILAVPMVEKQFMIATRTWISALRQVNSKSVAQSYDTLDVIAPNLKRRLSGVTATIARLVPIQANSIQIAATGPGLPESVPQVPLWRLLFLSRRLRVWHARRNNDLLLGLLLKWLGILKLRVVFTSASPRARSGWTQFLVSKCDEVIATNQLNADVMKRSCVIIPHGVDVASFSPLNVVGAANNQFLIGCYGRIRPLKGTQDFVEAMCRLLPDYPDWSAVVMGRALPRDRAFLDRLTKRIENAGLTDRIQIKPEVSLDDMPAEYRKLAIYVAPSYLEGFGLTVAEALSSGVPTVATRGVGAFDALIDPPKNGLLYQPGEIGDLQEKLLILMEDSEARRHMAQAARASAVERMSLQVEADQLVEVYRRLLIDTVPEI